MKKFIAAAALALAVLSACGLPAQVPEDSGSGQSRIEASSMESGAVETGDADPNAPIELSSLAHHYGAFPLDGYKPVKYDIEVFGEKYDNDGVGLYVDFSFSFSGSGQQCFRYELAHYPHIGSMDDGLIILDINDDGYQDIFLDVGTSGHMKFCVCYIFDSTQNEYVPVSGFDRLASPRISISQGGEVSVIVDGNPGNLEPASDGSWEAWSEYRVEGPELVLLRNPTNDEVLNRMDTLLN